VFSASPHLCVQFVVVNFVKAKKRKQKSKKYSNSKEQFSH